MLRRAAHVDVDDRGAGALGDARAFGHPARFAAGKLHDMQAGAVVFEAPPGDAFAFSERGAGRHFRDDEPRPCPAARRRNGASVTPDIGAKKTGLGSGIGPMEMFCTGMASFLVARRMRSVDALSRQLLELNLIFRDADLRRRLLTCDV